MSLSMWKYIVIKITTVSIVVLFNHALKNLKKTHNKYSFVGAHNKPSQCFQALQRMQNTKQILL